MNKIFILTACVATLSLAQQTPAAKATAYQSLVQDAKSRVQEVNVEQLKALKTAGETFTLIDVREDSEWTAGHAAGATHISKGIIERDIEAKVPQKSSKVVLYCGGGSRSALAADALMKMGYTNVVSLEGGMNAYKAAGLPTEKEK